MLRRRRQSAAEFKELLRDLAKMLVAASPTLNAEPEPERRLRQELHLAQFLCEEVAAHLDDTSFLKAEPEPAEESAERTGKDAASAENTPAAEDSQDEGVLQRQRERAKRDLVLRKAVELQRATANLGRFKRKYSKVNGLDGGAAGENWTAEVVEGRAGQSYREDARPRGRSFVRDPTLQEIDRQKREEREANRAAKEEEGSSEQPETVEAQYKCDLCGQQMRSYPTGLLSHRSGKRSCVRSRVAQERSQEPRDAEPNIQEAVASQSTPTPRLNPSRYPRAAFRARKALRGSHALRRGRWPAEQRRHLLRPRAQRRSQQCSTSSKGRNLQSKQRRKL